MIRQLLFAGILMACCVASHALGITAAAQRLATVHNARFWIWTGRFIGVAWWMVFVHLVEITLWAVFYLWQGAVPGLASALYFSAVTYTTTGYGDVVLPMDWRLVGAVEALTGILMCGWSTGFFFAVVGRLMQTEEQDAVHGSH